MDEQKTEAQAPVVVLSPEQKHSAAEKTVRDYVAWSLGAGILPMPLVDFAALSALQYVMLKKLCGIYGVAEDAQKMKRIVAALVGGLLPGMVASSLFKVVPFVGPALSLSTLPLLSGGSTYALGQVFVRHLEDGGTVLDFDAARMKDAFAKKYEEAKQIIPGMKKKAAAKPAEAPVG